MPSSITTGESIKLVCQDISILASSYVNPFQNISFLWALEMLLTFLQSENQGFPQCFDKMSLCLGQKFCSWVKQIQDFDGEYIWYLFYFPKEGRKKRILLNFYSTDFRRSKSLQNNFAHFETSLRSRTIKETNIRPCNYATQASSSNF